MKPHSLRFFTPLKATLALCVIIAGLLYINSAQAALIIGFSFTGDHDSGLPNSFATVTGHVYGLVPGAINQFATSVVLDAVPTGYGSYPAPLSLNTSSWNIPNYNGNSWDIDAAGNVIKSIYGSRDFKDGSNAVWDLNWSNVPNQGGYANFYEYEEPTFTFGGYTSRNAPITFTPDLPEPSSALLLGSGAMLLLRRRRAAAR